MSYPIQKYTLHKDEVWDAFSKIDRFGKKKWGTCPSNIFQTTNLFFNKIKDGVTVNKQTILLCGIGQYYL